MSAEIINLFQPETSDTHPGSYFATVYDHKRGSEMDIRYDEADGMFLVIDTATGNLIEYYNDVDIWNTQTRLCQIVCQTVMTLARLN